MARAKTVAPHTAMAKVPGCRPTSARIIRSPRQRSHRIRRGARRGERRSRPRRRFYQRDAPMPWGLPEPACHPERRGPVDFGLLVLRLAIGLTIAMHGYNKFFGGGRLPGTARWFESMGVRPGPPQRHAGRQHGGGRRTRGWPPGSSRPLSAAGHHRLDAGGHRRQPPQERVLHLPARGGLGVLRRSSPGRVRHRHDRRRAVVARPRPRARRRGMGGSGRRRGGRPRRRRRCSWPSATGHRRRPPSGRS